MNQAKPLTDEQKSHWAYLQGRTAGLNGERSERGWMAFGLSCAATELDAQNTRLWLSGFDAGEAERAAPVSVEDNAWLDKGVRKDGREYDITTGE